MRLLWSAVECWRYYVSECVCIQWNLCNPDTNGAEESVIVSEVSSFQRLKCMQEWYLGWEKVSSYTTPLPRNRLKESTRDVEREVPQDIR